MDAAVAEVSEPGGGRKNRPAVACRFPACADAIGFGSSSPPGVPFMRIGAAASCLSLVVAVAFAPGGSWSVAAPIPVRLQEHTGALLGGQIYIAGGFDSSDAPTRVAYRYDPAHDTWARIADLPADRHHMPLVVVGDTLYAAGGLEGQQFIPQTTLWIYRADRNTWETRAPLPAPRGASAAVADNGKLIVVGGFGLNRTLLDSIAVYDPGTNHWVNRAPIPTPRDHLTAGVAGGIVYAIGGRPLDPGRNYDVVEAYDPATDHWSTKSPMPSRRGGLASAVVGGMIHTFGGERRDGVFANHEVYDPARDAWTIAAPMPTARHGLAAVAVGDRIFVIGGGPKAGSAQTSVVEVWR
jgi:N-acetylneuraminic acid mutarotase